MRTTLGRRILVVEDEVQIRESIAEILEFEGFCQTTAENGLIGLKIAQEEIPDLIISDVMMPELDGYELVNLLRQDPVTASIPVILLTGKADRNAHRHGMELGADDYLVKPFTASELRRATDTQFQKQEILAQKNQEKIDKIGNSITFSLPNDLHVPLQNILGISTLLMTAWDITGDDEKLELVTAMHTSSQRLHRLTKNFLTYANLEIIISSPRKVKEFQKKVPHNLIKDNVERTALAEAKRMDRLADLHLDLKDAVVMASAESLDKIIRELLNNAFKFSQPGSRVSIQGRGEEKFYCLNITDEGLGMTSEQISDIGAYIKFAEARSSEHGIGLGLITAQRLVEIHGGILSIESIPYKETIVHVRLPILSKSSGSMGKRCCISSEH